MCTPRLCVIAEVELDLEVESKTPVAANDGTYQVVLAARRPMLTMVSARHLSPPGKVNAVIRAVHDDYLLGGYSGI